MQLYQKLNVCSEVLTPFLKSTFNFERIKEKLGVRSDVFAKL